MSLSGQQFKALRDALLDAFDAASFAEMLRFELDRKVEHLAGNGRLRSVAFEVINAAEQQGWILDLVRGARIANPRNPSLYKLAEMFELASTRALAQSDLGFEKVVRDGVPFLDPAAFRSKLGRLEFQVCAVEIAGVGSGSGILVGPRHVLTNHHVVAGANGRPITCRFDFSASADGAVINPGTVVAVEEIMDASPPSAGDPDLDAAPPAADELDYALLGLERAVGTEPAGSGNMPDAPVRSWTALAAAAIAKDDPIFVLQHPQSPVTWKLEPVKLTVGRALDTVGAGLRLRHDANTLPGSSGSPCFSAALGLVALHHAGGDQRYRGGHFNQAIPIQKIIDNLERRGILPLWRDAPPP